MTMNSRIPVLILAVLLGGSTHGAPPEGFYRTSLNAHQFDELVGVEPMGDGRILLWERGGLVLVSDSEGKVNPTPLLDIREEVLNWRDHGLLGVTVDPDFLENGYVYLLYAVDPHHLHEFGTPDYDPNVTWTQRATIGRLARYQATPESGFAEVDPSTRTILIGATIDTGLPIVHQSHSCGDLFFGTDGSLMLSHGDSANYGSVDGGGNAQGGYVVEALKNGILKPDEDVGAFRAQLLDTMCGKVLRLDPATGDGLPSNPFFDSADPDSARSRVWLLGVRNAFRCSILPGSGSDDPADGNPGILAINDVGWGLREETNTVDYPGANLGWPLWEGFDNVSQYWFEDTRHPLAPNPLAGSGCPDTFMFRDLVQEEQPGGPRFSNPCDPSWLEAESATINALDVDRNRAGSTGIGAMAFDGNGNEFLYFEIEGNDSDSTGVGIRYTLNTPVPATLQVELDGDEVTTVTLDPTPCSDCWVVRNLDIDVPSGNHQLMFTGGNPEGLRIDRFEIDGLVGPGIPQDIPTFVHHRPDVDWYHLGPQYARVAGFDEGVPVPVLLTAADSPVEGDSFMGNCAGGSEAINDPSWPEDYRGIFFSDVYFQWLRVLQYDEDGNPVRIRTFDNTAGTTVDAAYDEFTNNLYIVRWSTVPLVRYNTDPIKTCLGDFSVDGVVDGADLGIFISSWGTPQGDLDGDGLTDGVDLGLLLLSWGPCVP
ncbi:MAG: PQQ-dependent sugar dehydrogenase [Phycisphaerales bacterium]|nr:PQQ-dependent sugar dehydrogenase [Phycisphaerales bacterium]